MLFSGLVFSVFLIYTNVFKFIMINTWLKEYNRRSVTSFIAAAKDDDLDLSGPKEK